MCMIEVSVAIGFGFQIYPHMHKTHTHTYMHPLIMHMHPLIMHMHHDLPSYIVVSCSAHGSCFTYIRLLQLPVTNQKHMNLTSFKYQGKPGFS